MHDFFFLSDQTGREEMEATVKYSDKISQDEQLPDYGSGHSTQDYY